MFLIKLLRLFLGYVEFTATDGFSERFINLCSRENILLWNIAYKESSLTACIKAKDYKRIRRPAKNSGMHVRIKRKRGLPFVTFRHKARVGLAVGFIVLLIFVCFMSLIIWEIEVVGNVGISSEKILEIINDEGIKIGTFKGSIDATSVEKNSLSRLPGISWLSVNILGSKVQIEVRETQKGPDIIDLKTPVNVIAKKDGVIKKIEVYIGNKTVEINEAVLKGDLLISGVTVNKDNTEVLRHADGKVFAETKTVLYGKAEMLYNEQIISSSKSVYYVNFFSLKIPLCLRGDDFFSTDIMIKGKKSILPIGITRAVRYEYSEPGSGHTRIRAQLLCLLSLVESERKELEELERSGVSRSVMQSEASVTIKGEYKGIENIAEQREIYVEEK
ncbi:MAG: sporulation protein YqfD [Acutalibacteraceae bacterium]